MNAVRNVAIVTGTPLGIGEAGAGRLAADGFAVVVNYVTDAAEAQEVVSQISSAGGQAVAIQADLSQQAEFAHADGPGKPTRLLRASDRYNAQMMAELDSARAPN